MSKIGRESLLGATKRDRSSFLSARERLSSLSEEKDFAQIFAENCSRQRVAATPTVGRATEEPTLGDHLHPLSSGSAVSEPTSRGGRRSSSKSRRRSKCGPDILVIYDGDRYSIGKVVCKNRNVDRPILIALRQTLAVFANVSVLKLEFASLDNTHIRALRTLLLNLPNVTELSVDGNPNPYQNFYVLLKGTRLSQASFAHCQINDRGTRLIAGQLATYDDQSLYGLDMASNYVTDEGAAALAGMLRANRQLRSLCLADNWVTDEGLGDVVRVLGRFALKHEEVVLRRRRVVGQHKKKLAIMNKMGSTDSQSLVSLKNKRRNSSRPLKTNRTDETARSSVRKIQSARNNAGSPTKSVSSRNSGQKSLELLLGVDRHPYVKDSVPENKEIFCCGNFTLTHLNIGYNKLTHLSAKALVDMLRYQKAVATSNDQRGLKYVSLEGNDIADAALEQIGETIEASASKRSSSALQESLRKKRTSASSTGATSSKNIQSDSNKIQSVPNL